MEKNLKVNETAPVFDMGGVFAVAKRCQPIQFTFSYIAFPGSAKGKDAAALMTKAREMHNLLKDSQVFYKKALHHHHSINWDAPWYKVSKDLYENRLEPEVFDFLSKAQIGDISQPMVFGNGIYILMKEKLIPK